MTELSGRKAGLLCSYAEAIKRKLRHLRPDGPEPIRELRTMTETVQQFKYVEEQFYEARFLKQHERADYYGAPHELREFIYRFTRAAKKRGFPLYVHTVWRSPVLQEVLARDGHSQVSSGPHQRSCAADILHPDLHWDLPLDGWLYLGALGREVARQYNLPIQWGGDWNHNGVPVPRDPNEKFWDPAHWQIRDWKKYPMLSMTHKPERHAPGGLLT